MYGASAITILGILSKLFEFGKLRPKQTLTALTPCDKDTAILCLSVVAIVAIVAIVAVASSKQPA